MADILKYRKLDGTEVEVANNSTIALDHTEASIEFTVNLDQFDVPKGEIRGWFALAPTLSVPQTSDVYGITISPDQGQTVSVSIQTVDAKNLDNLQSRIFTRFSDTFTVSVVRASAPADSTTDSVPINFLTYPDSDAAIAIVNASFQITDSAIAFGIVDSSYVRSRQNSDFDFLTNLPKSIDSVGITRSLFDSDVRNSISVTDAGGDGSLTYNNSTGIITYTGPSATEVRSHFSAGGDLTFNQATGQFSFVFDSDFNKDLDSAVLGGVGLRFETNPNKLSIDSSELQSYFRQSIRTYFSGGTGVTYTAGSGVIAIGQPVATTDSVTFAGITVSGNLQVTGTTTTVNSTTLDVADKNITIAKGAINAAAADGGGITVDGAGATLTYSATGDKFVFNKPFQGSFLGSDSDFAASFAQASTDSLSEGSTNLYFTNERVDDRVGALITGGVNVTATYDDAAGTLEIKVPFENIDDRVGNILTAGSGININYDDPNATITVTNIADSAYIASLPVSTFTNDKNYLDSTTVKEVVDSAYVQLIQADLQRDSSFISSVVTGGALNMGANNIITTGKVLFANVYSQLSDLPNASTYHGMFAHVHATGKAYFAHAGAWIELANNSQLSNSSNWNTAFSWGDHSAAGYQLAATALDSAKTLQLVDSSVVLSKLHPNSFGRDSAVKLYYNDVKKFETTDSGAKITGDLTLKTSGATIRLGSLILQDSGGQLKIADSAGITTTVIHTVLDSALITQLIDAPYIQARQTLLDSDLALQLLLDSSEIVDLIDSAYIQTRQQKYNTSDFTDSAFVTGLPISTFTNDKNYLDSTTVQGVVDSAYIALRTTTGTDSATVIGLIDSDYIASRTIAVAQPQFVNYKYNADGNQTEFGGGVVDVNGQTVSLSPGNFSVFLNGIKLLDSDFTANTSTNVVTLSSGATLNDELVIQTVIGQNAIAGVSAVDSSYVQLRVPETYLSTIIDSDYVTARAGVVLDSASIASGVILTTVDAAYVQARQQKYNTSDFTDSAFVTGLPISTFTNDANYLDSTTITGVVNNAYVRARQALIDSDLTKLLVDSAYIQLRDRFQDSSLVTSTVDSSYVQLKVPASYIQANQTNFLDSSLTSQLIDSAYIALRTTAGTDSATVIGLIDSDYVAARVTGVVTPQFTDFRYKADSGQTLFSGADLGGTSLNLRTDNFNVFLNGIKLIDSDFTANISNNTITLTEGADSGDDLVITTIEGDVIPSDATIIDSAYVQARQEGVNATFKDFKFVATANQTVFSGNDANGTALSFETNKFHVLLNGIRLDASDFTESADNNKITLAVGAAVSDELIVSTIGTEKTTTLASITSTVDSAYVQARQADIFRDSAYIANIVDSALGTINVIGPNGPIVIGSSTPETTISGGTPAMQVVGSGFDGTQSITRRDNGQYGPSLMLAKSRNTTSGSHTIVQDGDTLGGVIFIGDDGTDLDTYGASITAKVNGTPGANDMPTSLHFNINRGTSTPYEAMKINHFSATDGYLHPRIMTGWNTTGGNTRDVAMHVAGHRYYFPAMAIEDYDPYTQYSGTFVLFYRNNTHAGSITSTSASSVSYGTSSDYRMKSNIADLDSAINIVKSLKPKKFKWKSEDSADYDNPFVMGFIAHEADSAIPLSQGIVIGDKDETDSHGTPKMQSMDYGKMTPLVVKALQEALEKIETLEAKVAALEGGG